MTDREVRERFSKRTLATGAARAALVLALCAFVALKLDLRGFIETLDRKLLWALLAMQGPLMVSHLFYSRRHAILVRRPPIPLTMAYEALILSATLNIVIPGRLAEAVKATYLRARAGVPLPQGLSAILIERLLDIVVVGAIASTGIAGIVLVQASYLLVIPVVALIALLCLRPLCELTMRRAHGSTRPIVSFVVRHCRHVVDVLTPSMATRAVVLTVGSWSAHYAALVLFFYVQPFHPLSLREVALVFGAFTFAAAIPALPAGVGLFEAAVVFVLLPLGYDFNQALAVGVTLHVAELLVAAIVGPALLMFRSMGVAELTADALAALRTPPAGTKQQ